MNGLAKVYDPQALGLQVAKQMGNEVMVFCPYHNDSRPSAEYNMEKGVFYCFGCSTSKTADELANDLGGYKQLISINKFSEERQYGEELDRWVHKLAAPLALGDQYLAKRKVTDEQVTKFKIRRDSEGIIFPLHDLDTSDNFSNVGVQVRRLDMEPKYMFYGQKPPLWPLKNIYGRGRLYVVEGIFGALRLDRFKMKSVAVMGAGSAASSKVARRLKWRQGSGKVYSLMDRDQAGIIAAAKLACAGIPAIIIPPKFRAAPDELSPRQMQEIDDQAEELATFDIDQILAYASDRYAAKKAVDKYRRNSTWLTMTGLN